MKAPHVLAGDGIPRDVPALYMSMDLATAVAEYEQELGIRPGTFCAYDVDTAGILDLCQPEILVATGIEPELRFADWKTTLLIEQRRPGSLGYCRQLIAAGLAGILVPSTRLPGGRNLVLWHWNDAPRPQSGSHSIHNQPSATRPIVMARCPSDPAPIGSAPA